MLLNLGTPDSPEVPDVRRYLAEFLMDPLVIDIPSVPRWLLVHGIILRTRPRKSAEAYRSIWTERGSPLSFHGEDLARGVAAALGGAVAEVALAMRYQNPGVAAVLDRFRRAGIDDVLVVPLFPQYSMAAWHSAVKKVFDEAGAMRNVPNLRFVPPYFDHPAFLDAVAAVARPVLDEMRPDKVVLSFHGIPEKHCTKSDESGGRHCFARPDCCETLVAANRFCYRAQCIQTAKGIASRLGLGPEQHEVSFQSRLTKNWITPFTDLRLKALPGEGHKRVAVLCPAFVADCLETIEEIGIRGREDFEAAGGEELRLVPCVNADPAWVEGVAALVRENLPRAGDVT
jgi:ferrochelatase